MPTLEVDTLYGSYWTSTVFHKNIAWAFNTYESAFVTKDISTSVCIRAMRAI